MNRTGVYAPAPSRFAGWRQESAWLAVAGPVLLFAGHALYGAMLPPAALSLSLAGSLLAVGCLTAPRVRRDLASVRGLALPGALFGLVIFVGLWSLTPYVPGGPHPVWAYLGISPGAATIDKSLTLLELIKLLGLGSLFIVGLATGASDRRARLAVNVTLALGAMFGLWSFLSFVGGGDRPGHPRLEASFLAANTAATFFAVLLVLALGPAVSRARSSRAGQRFSSAIPYAGAALIAFACLMMTASRGGFAAAAAGLVAFAGLQIFSGKAKLSRAMLTGAGAALLGALFLVVGGDLLISRLLEGGHDLAGRAGLFRVHWQAFEDAPWLGYGLGAFDTVHRTLLDSANLRELWTARAAHNVYLTWLEQAGVLGALPMFGCIGGVIAFTLRGALRRSRMTSVLFALIAMDLVLLTHGLSDFALEVYSIAAFWSFLLGLQFSLAQGSSTR